jgi:hypothetical protein
MSDLAMPDLAISDLAISEFVPLTAIAAPCAEPVDLKAAVRDLKLTARAFLQTGAIGSADQAILEALIRQHSGAQNMG